MSKRHKRRTRRRTMRKYIGRFGRDYVATHRKRGRIFNGELQRRARKGSRHG